MATVKLATLVIRVSQGQHFPVMTRGLRLDMTDACEAHLYAIEEPGQAVRVEPQWQSPEPRYQSLEISCRGLEPQYRSLESSHETIR
jgi:hypothetical protein